MVAKRNKLSSNIDTAGGTKDTLLTHTPVRLAARQTSSAFWQRMFDFFQHTNYMKSFASTYRHAQLAMLPSPLNTRSPILTILRPLWQECGWDGCPRQKHLFGGLRCRWVGGVAWNADPLTARVLNLFPSSIGVVIFPNDLNTSQPPPIMLLYSQESSTNYTCKKKYKHIHQPPERKAADHARASPKNNTSAEKPVDQSKAFPRSNTCFPRPPLLYLSSMQLCLFVSPPTNLR